MGVSAPGPNGALPGSRILLSGSWSERGMVGGAGLSEEQIRVFTPGVRPSFSLVSVAHQGRALHTRPSTNSFNSTEKSGVSSKRDT